MKVRFKHWSRIALWKRTSCTSVSHRQQLRINRFRFVHGVSQMLILFWMDLCHWILAKLSLSEAYRVLWKHVSIFCLLWCDWKIDYYFFFYLSGVGNDYGSFVWRRLLCWNWHRSRVEISQGNFFILLNRHKILAFSCCAAKTINFSLWLLFYFLFLSKHKRK